MIDIVADTGDIALGRGWHPLETHRRVQFRWAKGDAEILVAALKPANYALRMTIEPGPGVGMEPFDLQVFDGDVKIATLKIVGKQPVRFALPSSEPKIYLLLFHVDGGGKPAPDDPRIMNFRVFDVQIERGPRDIFPQAVQFGKGWYPLEQYAGEVFRWVNNDAELTVPNAEGAERLRFVAESGPGLQRKPFVLMVHRREQSKTSVLAEVEINGRQSVELPLPQGDTVDLVLHADSENYRVPGESRVLNFRVFLASD